MNWGHFVWAQHILESQLRSVKYTFKDFLLYEAPKKTPMHLYEVWF